MCLPQNINKYTLHKTNYPAITEEFQFELPDINDYHIDDPSFRLDILSEFRSKHQNHINSTRTNYDDFPCIQSMEEEMNENSYLKSNNLNNEEAMSNLAIMMCLLLLNKTKNIEEYFENPIHPVNEVFNLLVN